MIKKKTIIGILSVAFLSGTPDPPEGFEFNQSQRQAFFVFITADINDQLLSEGDWVGAFKIHDETLDGACETISENCPDINEDGTLTDDASVCVGSRMWEGPYTPIPVMGADFNPEIPDLCELTGTCYYLELGDIPIFKIYDSASNAVVPAEPSAMEPFVDLGVYIVDRLTYFTYSMILEAGHNLISFNALRTDNSLNSMLEPLEFTISTIIGEALASNFIDGNWVGSIESIDFSDGYWITVDSPALFLTHGYPLDLLPEETIVYELNNFQDEGNLISWPSSNLMPVGEAIPDDIEGAFLGVFSEGMAAQQINSDWEGTLTHFEELKGYWVLLHEPVSFSFNTTPTERKSDFIPHTPPDPPLEFSFNQSTSQSFYFVGNLEINNHPATPGNWIISSCGDIITGARIWTGSYTDVPVMGDDGSAWTDGYCVPGETPQFTYVDDITGDLIPLESNDIPEWSSNRIFNIDLYGNSPESGIPENFRLSQPYPNPFNSTVNIQYTIAQPSNVTIQIIDTQGRLIDMIESGTYKNYGQYEIAWQTDDVSSGMYFIRMNISESQNWMVQKIMLIK